MQRRVLLATLPSLVSLQYLELSRLQTEITFKFQMLESQMFEAGRISRQGALMM